MRSTILLIFFFLLSIPLRAQNTFEIGAFAELVDLKVKHEDYKIANPPLSVGGYACFYIKKPLGICIGLQYLHAPNSEKYILNLGNYNFDYEMVKIPLGLMGDFNNWLYYRVGVNLLYGKEKFNPTYSYLNEKINGIDYFADLGLHTYLIKNVIKLRLGILGSTQNVTKVSENTYSLGLKLSLALRF
jgi:hypothetical protein